MTTPDCLCRYGKLESNTSGIPLELIPFGRTTASTSRLTDGLLYQVHPDSPECVSGPCAMGPQSSFGTVIAKKSHIKPSSLVRMEHMWWLLTMAVWSDYGRSELRSWLGSGKHTKIELSVWRSPRMEGES